MTDWELCWFTGKRMLTKKQARRVRFYINRDVSETGEGKTIKGIYLCEHCDKYHVSSMNQFKHYFKAKRKDSEKITKIDQIKRRLDYLKNKIKSKKKP
jgi:hypothetical protein